MDLFARKLIGGPITLHATPLQFSTSAPTSLFDPKLNLNIEELCQVVAGYYDDLREDPPRAIEYSDEVRDKVEEYVIELICTQQMDYELLRHLHRVDRSLGYEVSVYLRYKFNKSADGNVEDPRPWEVHYYTNGKLLAIQTATVDRERSFCAVNGAMCDSIIFPYRNSRMRNLKSK